MDAPGALSRCARVSVTTGFRVDLCPRVYAILASLQIYDGHTQTQCRRKSPNARGDFALNRCRV